MQSKPFLGTQNMETIERYSAFWSQLVLFLWRVQDLGDSVLASQLLAVHGDKDIAELLNQTKEAAAALHAVNPQGRAFVDCLRDNKSDDITRLRQHAKTLEQRVDKLSMGLITQSNDRSPFSLCVVAYSATCVLTKHGSWVTATGFRPFLSGMIYCMQLWLLGFCLRLYRRQSPRPSLSELVRD